MLMVAMSGSQPLTRPSPPAGQPGVSPLSHHAIMQLVSPFTQRGYAVDMAASDRRQNKLAFRPIEVAAEPGLHPKLRCILRFEQPHRAKVRLTRTLETLDGLTATVVAEGIDAAALLNAIEAVAIARQVRFLGDLLLVRHYRITLFGASGARGASAGRTPATPRLIGAETRIGSVQLSAAEGEWRDFELKLTVDARLQLHLTEDLLAVLGRSWRPMRRDQWGTWTGSVKSPAREPKRTATLERLFDTATRHLAATFNETPAAFHGRHRRARWRAAFQRLLPLLGASTTVVGFVVLLFFLPKTQLFHMIMFHMSVVAIIAMSLLNKAYRLELPPIPRTLTQPHWWSNVGEAI